jgi:hypothetical protein
MTVSLNGFIADRDSGVERLYPDVAALRGSDSLNEKIARTGAVLMEKRTFEMADDPDAYPESYEFRVPIFVVTHHPPRA